MRAVFDAWEELPDVWREVFTTNGPALLAELRGGETTENGRFHELEVPALVLTASASPEAIRLCSEALGRALPRARSLAVGGDHAIDPAGEEVVAFVRDARASSRRN